MKNYIWIVEVMEHESRLWHAAVICFSRKDARRSAERIRVCIFRKTRVVKYVRAEK